LAYSPTCNFPSSTSLPPPPCYRTTVGFIPKSSNFIKYLSDIYQVTDRLTDLAIFRKLQQFSAQGEWLVVILVVDVKGCSRIDSIVLGQHAVYHNLEERKKERQELAAVPKSVDPVSDRIL
jgi:hypothetical protein